jgi:putative SOS response-associated peptidase YedK
MCGRFVAATDPDGLVRFFTIDERKTDDLPPSYNVAPTDPVYAVAAVDNRRYLVSFQWGLVPHWADSPRKAATMINARAETVASKPAFRDAVRRRRCLIPANGFYEWTKGAGGRKVPHYITPDDGQLLAFAGVWETWRDPAAPQSPPLRSCTIITRSAEGPVTELHDRMPLALTPDLWSLWLSSATEAGEVTAMLHAEPPPLQFREVSPRVNTVANNDAQLLEPAAV